MGVIVFLLVLVLVAAVVGGLLFGGQYLAYRRDAQLERLDEIEAELRTTKKALNIARSTLAQVGNQYSHNPPLAALQALDAINELTIGDVSYTPKELS